MACPTCNATMQRFGDTGQEGVFWCPRCGTFQRGQEVTQFSVGVPMLVQRTRDLWKDGTERFDNVEQVASYASRLGIFEALGSDGSNE